MIRPLAFAAGLALALAAGAARGGVAEAVQAHVMPGLERFHAGTEGLARAAARDCTAGALRPHYQAAFDAWMGISHLRFGPLEEQGRALAIGFWPDTRGMVRDTVARLIAQADPVVGDPGAFAEVSVAGRGLFALERLLYEPDLAG